MSSALRVALGADGVSIWSSEIFGTAEPSRVRNFLSRAFAVQEVERVELQRATSFGRIRYGAVASPAQVWKKLSQALCSPEHPPAPAGSGQGRPRRIDAGHLYLGGPSAMPVRISRIGNVLSTWRVRHQSDSTLRLWHPVLRNRRDVVFRLEEELAAILGVEDCRASALTAGVSIRFDKSTTTAERLATELEQAWPRLLEGLDGPPSQKRLVAAVGLVGLAFTGQFLVPAVRPIAVAGMTLYSFPNVVNGAKQLTRGEVGLSALYATGVGFMLVSGLPFTASVMAALMQFWPQLARRKIVRSQRRLFAEQRRRPAWARIARADGTEVEVSVDALRRDDLVVVRRGEIVPVDGVVAEGSATVVDGAPFAGSQLEHRLQGDAVAAGAFVRTGSLKLRVERAGAQTCASHLAALLPHTPLAGLPSSLEVERIANRNAKPALALSALSLLLTRSLPPSQAVIRPDYATAPRLSAQLSALQSIAHGLQQGALFRNPAALDRLALADVYVIDDSAGLERRGVEVATVQTANGASAELVVGYALAADPTSRTEQGRALAAFASKRKAVHPQAESIRREAGVTRYTDSRGRAIEIATPRYLAASKVDVPERIQTRRERPHDGAGRRIETDGADAQSSFQALWVLRDGKVIGVVSFARTGEIVSRGVVAALRAQNQKAQLVYVSRGGEVQARQLAGTLGIKAYGSSSQAAKAEVIRRLGGKTLWIGDGSDPEAQASIAESSVSVSVAPLSRSRQDVADILLPHDGISGLPALIDNGRAHAQRLAKDYRTLYAANLLGVAGGFLASFSPLQVGLLSNLGTALIYARHARALDRLASAAERQRARQKASLLG